MPVVLERFANDAATTLSALIVDAVVTSITVTSATLFPPAAQFRVKIDSELLLVTAGAGTTTWTVTRGVEGTTAAAHSNGAAVTHVLTRAAQERWVPDYPVWMPRHNNLLFGSGDPTAAAATQAMNVGLLRLAKIWIPEAVVVASLVIHVVSSGATLTAGQCFAGLYDSSGALIAKTADQSSAWLTTGVKVMALTAEAGKSLTPLPGGPGVWMYAVVLVNGTTAPTLRLTGSGTTSTETNTQLVSTDGFRAATAGTALTALPSTLPATTSSASIYFAGLI
jgi:hypothetical protein